MHVNGLERYVCPTCKVALSLTAPAEEEVLEGSLRCSQCAAEYPVRDGIPRFAPVDNYAASFGWQWNRFARTQLDSQTGLGLTAKRFWAETRWATDLSGQTVLEAGSGAGRFTEVLATTGARVFTFDYSAAVDANRRSNAKHSQIDFAQASIFEIPYRSASFDKVLCLGVIQHTPSPRAAVRALAEAVKPGGELVFDCYPINPLTVFRGKYLLRLATAGKNPEKLFPWVERWFSFWYGALGRARAVAGDPALYLSDLVGVCDYRHELKDIPEDVLREMALLDTYDMLAPRYDKPQRRATLTRWMQEDGLVDIEVTPGYNGFEARGRKR